MDLALDSHHSNSLRFVFTSSVSSAQSWDCKRGAFPEEVQFDPSLAVGSGYGESKYVCERVRRHYLLDGDVSTSIVTLDHRQEWSPRDIVAHWPDRWWRTQRIVGNDGLGTDHCQVKRCSWSLA